MKGELFVQGAAGRDPSPAHAPTLLPFHILSFPPSPPSPIPTFPLPTLPSLPTLLPLPTCSPPHLLCSSPTFSPYHHYFSTPYFPASEHFGPGTEDFHNLLAMHYGQVQVISARAVLYDLLKRCAGEVEGQCVWGEGISAGMQLQRIALVHTYN